MRRAALLSILLVLPLSSRAGSLIPVLDITGGGTATVPLADAVGGWQFHLNDSLTISALGAWDEGGLPLQIAHDIGLWTLSDTLLATATVANNNSVAVASASPDGRWLFTPISPIELGPGDYVLGAVWGDPMIGADPFRFGTTTSTSFGASFIESREATLLPGPILVFPGDLGPPNGGIFGPNMALTIPEPSASVLLFSGATLCLALRRLWP